MKTAKSNIRLLAYGLCLAVGMYNCKTKDVDSLTPFTYTFKGLEPVTLPIITPTAPAAVSVVAASVTSSTAAAAVNSGLSSMSATGVVPASVQQAATDVSKVISATAAAQLTASFTPAVINTFATTGVLPAALKTQLAALTSNPALKAYLPTYTLPAVNGKPVGGRAGATGDVDIVATVSGVKASLDDDACKAAAKAAYNTALDALAAAKTSQSAPIEKAYSDAQAAANAETAPCKAGLSTKYDPLRATAQAACNSAIAILDANKAIFGDDYYLLKIFQLATLNEALDLYNRLQAVETTTCDQVSAAKLANAKVARDKDINTINDNYNTGAATLLTNYNKATASCHNQGNGG